MKIESRAMNDLLVSIATYTRPLFAILVFAVAFVLYGKETFACTVKKCPRLQKLGKDALYLYLIYTTLAFYVLNALFLTIAQYFTWAGSAFTSLLLRTPMNDVFENRFLEWMFENKLGYFLFYSWGSFWLEVLLIGTMSFLFWSFLRVLRRYNDRFFEVGEVELGTLMVLLVGWPGAIVFIGMVFFSVVLVSLVRLIFFKEAYTTLGYPFLIAAGFTLLFSNTFLILLRLDVFRITMHS